MESDVAKLLVLKANPEAVSALQSLRGEGLEIAFENGTTANIDLNTLAQKEGITFSG